MEPRRTRTLLGTALALALLAGACGETDDEKAESGPSATATSAPAAAKTLEVTGADYAFEDVPASVAAGTTVSFKNSSAKEVHELVALRVKDGDDRPLSTILALPEAERDQAAEFRGVSIAFPNEPGFTPEGPVVLNQPGRYIFVCTIPVGADPAAYRAAAQKGGGPVEVPGGPPHVARGMVTELKVT